MGKLRGLSGQEVCRILERNGFQRIRQKGSHIIVQKEIGTSTITIPVPNHRELALGTLFSIIRQSSLPKHLFES